MNRWKTLKNHFSLEYLLVFIFSGIIIAVSFAPTIYQYRLTPQNKVFLGTYNSLVDFPIYISTIRQGQSGKLFYINKMTSEPQMPTLVHGEYSFFGLIFSPFHLDPVLVFQIMRLLTSFAWLFTIYEFIKLFFGKVFARLNVFFLTVFIGGFPRILYDNARFYLPEWTYMYFFSGFDVLRRITFLPHGEIRDIFFLWAIIFLIKSFNAQKRIFYWLGIIFTLFLGLFSPVHSFILYLLIHLYGLLATFLSFKKGATFKNIFKTLWLKIIIYDLLTLPFNIYEIWVFSQFPWNIVRAWELQQKSLVPIWEYILGVGPIFFLGLIGFILIFNRLWKSHQPLDLKFFSIMAVPLLVLPFIFTQIGTVVGVSNFRFLGLPLYPFYAILAGLAINTFIKKRKTVLVIVIILFLAVLPNYYVSLKIQKNEADALSIGYNIYPDKSLYDGFIWLANNTKPDEIVLSEATLGNLIPAFSGNTVYIGHPVSTYNYQAKKAEVDKFYTTTEDPNSVFQFLKSRGIKWVIWSYDENSFGGNLQKYSFLKPRFQNSEIQIYEVK